ncbi:MAG: MFS transporter [Rhodobacteraceae bacterium]|nr:MFS transporter [Paracoccaceae bacterium]
MLTSRTPPHLATLTLLTAVSMLTLNMVLPSLPAMTRELHTDAAIMALAVSGYMLMSAVLQLGLGPLSDRVGRRPVLLWALGVYVAASVGCVLAQDITVFLICRLAQGAVIAGSVLSSAIIRDQFPPRIAASKLGAIAAAMALAPMIGPMVGGLLETTIGWRMIFVLYTGLGTLGLALVWVDLGETLSRAPRPIRAADYGALLGSGLFWAYVLCQAFSVGAFYIFITGVPFVATSVYSLSPALIGLGVGSITAGFMLGATLTARLAPRLGLARLILAGRLVPSIGLGLAVVLFATGFTHPLWLFGLTLTTGFGNGLTLSNANAGALSVRPDLAGTAAGLSGALSIGLGAALTWGTALIIGARGTPLVLLSLMLVSVLVSLAAGIVAVRKDPSMP